MNGCYVIVDSVLVSVVTLLIILLLLYMVAGIPIVKIGHLALYPAFFSVLFALILSQGTWQLALLIILRALGAALTLIFLFATTPYIQLFSYLSYFMPELLGDIFLFTYRGLFILLYKCTNLLRVIKMRGGFRPYYLFYNFRNTAGIIGLLFIHSMTISERMYHVFLLRGYKGGVHRVYNRDWLAADYIVLSIAAIIVISVVVL